MGFLFPVFAVGELLTENLQLMERLPLTERLQLTERLHLAERLYLRKAAQTSRNMASKVARYFG